VTESVHGLLSHISKDTKWIWIDAICIDQGSNAEKAKQIGLMARIYWQASLVHIWLGPRDEDSDTAMDFIIVLRRQLPNINISNNPAFEIEQIEAPDGQLKWNVSGRLSQRTWFHRVWVLQETALSRRAIFYCGNGSVLWVDLWNIFENLRRLQLLTRTGEGSQRVQPMGTTVQLRAYRQMQLIEMFSPGARNFGTMDLQRSLNAS